MEFRQDQVGHQEIAVVLQFGVLFLDADLLAYLTVETGHHFAEQQRHLFLQNAVGGLPNEIEKHRLSFAHDIYGIRILMLTPVRVSA